MEQAIADSKDDDAQNYSIHVEYEPKLVNIMLMGVEPGYEYSVIENMQSKVSELDMQHQVPTPQFATLIGRFELASVFLSTDFDACRRLQELEHVNSQQFVLGTVPRPTLFACEVLNQSSTSLMKNFTKENTDKPIVAIVLIQLSAPLTYLLGGHILHLTIYAIDQAIAALVDSNTTDVTVIDNYGWNELTVVVHSNSVDEITAVISAVSNLQLSTLVKFVDQLHKNNPDTPYFADAKNAARRRIPELLIGYNESDEGTISNHLVLTTSTVLGLVWPCVHDLLRSQQDPTAGHEWNISGKISSISRFSIKAGHLNDARKAADSISEGNLYGFYDIGIYSSETDFVSAVLQIYSQRLDLLQLDSAEFRNDFWRNRESSHTGKYSNILIDSSTDIFTRSEATSDKSITIHTDRLNHRITNKVNKMLGQLADKTEEVLAEQALSQHVASQLILSSRSVWYLWSREMLSFTNMFRMMELTGAYIAWLDCMKQLLQLEGSDPRKIQSHLRSLVEDFGPASTQRVLSSYAFSEFTDLNSEFKGGLSQILTAIDGIMKAVLSLNKSEAGWLQSVGALTLIWPQPIAEFSRRLVDNASFYAVIRLNSHHILQPIRTRSLLHEMLHIIVDTPLFSTFVNSRVSSELLMVPRCADEISEISVELLIIKLVFRNNVDLFTRNRLMNLSLDLATVFSIEHQDYQKLIVNVYRQFVIYRVFNSNDDQGADGLRESFSRFWRKYSHALGIKQFALSETIEENINNDVYVQYVTNSSSLTTAEFDSEIALINENIDSFFQLDSSRRFLASRIEKDMPMLVSVVKTSLKRGSPIVIPSKTPKGNSREVGINNLFVFSVLLRSYCEYIDDGLLAGKSGNQYQFDASRSSDAKFRVDRVTQSIVGTTSNAKSEEFLARIAFIKSLWSTVQSGRHRGLVDFMSGQTDSPAF